MDGEYRFDVAASDPDAGDTVTLDVAGLPDGAQLDPELPITGSSVSSEFNWIPLQTGKFIINFYATSSTGTTVQCPVEIDVVDIVGPDVTVLEAGFYANVSDRSARVTVRGTTASVANLGNVQARTSVLFEFIGSSGAVSARARQSITLDPGEQMFIQPSNPIRSLSRGDGPWVYRVTIDPQERVVEIDEGNNIYESQPFFEGF